MQCNETSKWKIPPKTKYMYIFFVLSITSFDVRFNRCTLLWSLTYFSYFPFLWAIIYNFQAFAHGAFTMWYHFKHFTHILCGCVCVYGAWYLVSATSTTMAVTAAQRCLWSYSIHRATFCNKILSRHAQYSLVNAIIYIYWGGFYAQQNVNVLESHIIP